MIDNFLNTSFIYLLMAVIVVPLSKRLGLGSVLGYLLAGVFIGPISGIAEDNHSLLAIGEIGVVMMLFLIGLELEPKVLWKLRFKLLGMGGLQVFCSTVLLALVASFVLSIWQQAAAIGLILALSSTAIVMQTLHEKKLEKTPAGQAMFSVLLFQDIAVIPIIAIMSLLAFSADTSVVTELQTASFDSMLFDSGYALLVILVSVAVVVLGYLCNKPVFQYIARTGLREIFTATALLLVVGSALLMDKLGLSPALGTFVAGVVLARSEFVHEIRSSVEPFKGLLLGLFFVGVGMGMNLGLMSEKPLEIIMSTVALILVKLGVLLWIARIFRMPRVNSWLFALGLAQAGEFGFVLISFALSSGVIGEILAEEIVVIVTLSMLVTPLLFIVYNLIERNLRPENKNTRESDQPEQTGQVVVAGIGRFGRIVNHMLVAQGYQPVVVDKDAVLLEKVKRIGVKAYFGDITRPDMLNSIGLAKSQLLIVAISGKNEAVQLVKYVRRHYPHLKIIARARDRLHLYSLRKAGADLIVHETFDAATRCAKNALELLGTPKLLAKEQTKTFIRHELETIEQLFEVWDQNHKIGTNKAYLSGIKQRNEELRKILAGNTKTSDEKAAKKRDEIIVEEAREEARLASIDNDKKVSEN